MSSFAGRLCVLIVAADRPFLDAGEVIVSAVAGLPHREDERQIGLLGVFETLRDLFELDEGAVRLGIRIALLEPNDPVLAGGRTALEPDIDQFRDGGARRNFSEAAAAQDRGFEGELR